MKRVLVKSVTTLLAAAGTAWCQAPAPTLPPSITATSSGGDKPATVIPAGDPRPAGPAVRPPDLLHDVPATPPCADVDPPIPAPACNDLPGYRFWGGAEYLLWKFKPAPLLGLDLSANFTFNVPQPTSLTSTFVVGSSGDVDYASRSGVRLSGGYWLDRDQTVGVEASYFQFERKANTFTPEFVSQTMTVTTPPPDNQNLTAGLGASAAGAATPLHFLGAEVNARSKVFFFGPVNFDLLGGFRYLDLDESLDVFENVSLTLLTPPVTTPILPGQLSAFDQIATRNRFYGGQVGTSFEWWLCDWLTVGGFGKVALGGVNESVTVSGMTATTNPLLAVPSPTQNFGLLSTQVGGPQHDSRTRLALVPELNASIGLQLTSHLRLFAAYDFIMFSDVARPGNQVDFSTRTTSLSVSAPPTAVSASQPGLRMTESDFWAHGVNFGFEFRY